MITRLGLLVSFSICHLSCFVSAMETDNSYHPYRFQERGKSITGEQRFRTYDHFKYGVESPYPLGNERFGPGQLAGGGDYPGEGKDWRRLFLHRDRQGRYGGFGGGGGGVGRGYGGGPAGNAFAQGYGGYRGAGRGYGGGGGGYFRGAQGETEGVGNPMRRPYDSPPGAPQERYDTPGRGGMPVFTIQPGRFGLLGRFPRRSRVPGDSPNYDLQGEKILGVYYSLPDAIEGLKALTNFTNNKQYIPLLLTTFQRNCRRQENRTIGTISEVQSGKRNIIINIEGTSKDVSRDIVMMVAKRLGAEVSFPPVTSLEKFKPAPTKQFPELIMAYYGLAFYAVADDVKAVIDSVPIVLSSYWLDQCIYGVIKYYDELPEANSSVYAWPEDLLKPDVLFFLNLPDSVPSTVFASANFFKPKQVAAFRGVQDPKAIEINSITNQEEVVSIIVKHVKDLIGGGQAPKN